MKKHLKLTAAMLSAAVMSSAFTVNAANNDFLVEDLNTFASVLRDGETNKPATFPYHRSNIDENAYDATLDLVTLVGADENGTLNAYDSMLALWNYIFNNPDADSAHLRRVHSTFYAVYGHDEYFRNSPFFVEPVVDTWKADESYGGKITTYSIDYTNRNHCINDETAMNFNVLHVMRNLYTLFDTNAHQIDTVELNERSFDYYITIDRLYTDRVPYWDTENNTLYNDYGDEVNVCEYDENDLRMEYNPCAMVYEGEEAGVLRVYLYNVGTAEEAQTVYVVPDSSNGEVDAVASVTANGESVVLTADIAENTKYFIYSPYALTNFMGAEFIVYTELEEAIAAVEAVSGSLGYQENNYTEDSYKALSEAYENALSTMADPTVTQEDVDAAAAALVEATNNAQREALTTTEWTASEDNANKFAGTELMENLTVVFDTVSSSEADATLDGTSYDYSVSGTENATVEADGSVSGTALKYEATESGILTVVIDNLAVGQTAYIVKQDADGNEVVASAEGAGSITSVSGVVKEGETYYIYVEGGAAEFAAASFDDGTQWWIASEEDADNTVNSDLNSVNGLMSNFDVTLSAEDNSFTYDDSETLDTDYYISGDTAASWDYENGYAVGTSLTFVPEEDGTIEVFIADLPEGAVAKIAAGGTDPANALATVVGDGSDTSISAQVTAGETYYIYVEGENGEFSAARFTPDFTDNGQADREALAKLWTMDTESLSELSNTTAADGTVVITATTSYDELTVVSSGDLTATDDGIALESDSNYDNGYASFIPVADGVITVTAKASDIASGDVYACISAYINDDPTDSLSYTELGDEYVTIYLEVEAGKTYFIYGTDGAVISEISYVPVLGVVKYFGKAEGKIDKSLATGYSVRFENLGSEHDYSNNVWYFNLNGVEKSAEFSHAETTLAEGAAIEYAIAIGGIYLDDGDMDVYSRMVVNSTDYTAE